MTEVEQMIDDCKKRASKMTDWEVSFIYGLREDRIGPMQLAKLEEIWERIT